MRAATCGCFKQLLHPYYIINIILSLVFVASKTLPYACDLLYTNCSIDLQEYEILIFLAAFVTMRNKRQYSMTDYVAHFCMFAKLCNLFMFWRQSTTYATIYGVLWLLQSYFLFQPVYDGPEVISYFRQSTFAEVSCISLDALFVRVATSAIFSIIIFGRIILSLLLCLSYFVCFLSFITKMNIRQAPLCFIGLALCPFYLRIWLINPVCYQFRG